VTKGLFGFVLAAACGLSSAVATPASAQEGTTSPALVQAVTNPAASAPDSTSNNYIVGPQDVLAITCYDQSDLTGKFSVETDGSFTYPFIGRVKIGGLTLREVERVLKVRLKDGGFFKNPQITVAVEQYKSQRVFVVGEVRTPGTYTLSGDMSLVEALARAGSTLPSAGGEAIIVHPDPSRRSAGPVLPDQHDRADIVHVNLRDLEKGAYSQNAALRDGDTVFVPRAESIYVFGLVKSPGSYPLPQGETTVLQALSLGGGMSDRGSTSRIRVIRVEHGVKREFRVQLSDPVKPGDTIVVPERFF
jgi:polysaccharide biosynthesis/export protein